MRDKKRWIRAALFVCYCLFIVWYTVLSRKPGAPKADLRFMWSYRDLIAGKSTAKADVIQNLNNILFFIPFGFLIPAKRWWVVIVSVAVFSLLVEVAQYIGGYGLAELDDVICNTLGAFVGYGLRICVKRIGQDED